MPRHPAHLALALLLLVAADRRSGDLIYAVPAGHDVRDNHGTYDRLRADGWQDMEDPPDLLVFRGGVFAGDDAALRTWAIDLLAGAPGCSMRASGPRSNIGTGCRGWP